MDFVSIPAVTELLQASALDLGQWEESLESIATSFQVAGVVLLSSNPRFDLPIGSSRMLASSDDYVRNGWNERDERYRAAPKLIASGLITDDDVSTETGRKASPFYQEFLKRHGLGLFACVGFRAGDDLWGMSIQRNFGEGGFSGLDMTLIRKLWRPLSDAATLSRQLSFARVLGTTDAYEHMRQPAIALSADLRVLAYNERARLLCGRLFDTLQGKIRFKDVRSDTAFNALIRRLRADLLPPTSPVSTQVADGQGGKVPLRLIELAGWSRLAFVNAKYLLLVGNVEYDDDRAISLFRERFSLTAAEARIAYALLSGRSLFDIAAEAKISYETVRKHLKTVFGKVGVRRQAELASVLQRDDLDEMGATIRMGVRCRGEVMMRALIDARKRVASR